jgi:cobalamin biosynthesis Mg chelatase CobN
VRNGTTWSQQAYLKASNTGVGDYFGTSVSISGDTIVMSAENEDSNATGVNGDQSNNNATNSGAAYVFVRNETAWIQQAYLKAGCVVPDGQFGIVLAIDEFIVVGKDNMVTVFDRVQEDSTSTTVTTGSTGTAVSTTVTTGSTGTTNTIGVTITSTSTVIGSTEVTSDAARGGDDDSTMIVIVVVVSVVVLAIVAAVIGFLLFRRNRNNAHNSGAASLTLQSKSTLKNIKIEELLGSGNFGEL